MPYKEFFVFSMCFHIFFIFERMFWIIPLGWSRNLDLKKVSCYYWHVFTRFRMECPTHVILCYFIIHVPDLNDKVGEWHCYRWNISLKYALCYIHQREEKDFTDDQQLLKEGFQQTFLVFSQNSCRLRTLLSQGPEGRA